MTAASKPALRDYTANSRILYVSALAAGLGAVSAVAAWLLLEMIALATNLFYFHRWSFAERDPWQAGVHWYTPAMPVIGGLLVGVIARYLSPRVRGHGMPEAIETIVFGGGRVQPRVAVLKPLATAISIGSGGPFGAEGPVIMTGGAIGSVLAQALPMTSSERTVLMVSGAAAGMAATFNCPFSAILLAVEILLFEWRPRSLVPVAMACVTAGVIRRLLLGPEALLEMPDAGVPIYHSVMWGALLLGIVAAFAAAGLGRAIRWSEYLFEKIPLHWMWYPAIGGVFIGLGGLAFPRALGVGYSVIRELVLTDAGWKLLVGVLVIKSLIWVISLGSQTAAGILAPLLMIGGAMGAAIGHIVPGTGPSMSVGSWAVVGMTSLLTAAIGCPLTSSMLALELTSNAEILLPVLLASVTAYAVSVLVQPRSLLTAGLSRRGLHLSREYGVDPLEMVFVAQAMRTSVFALTATATRRDAAAWLSKMQERGVAAWSQRQSLFPLVDAENDLVAVLTRAQMIRSAAEADQEAPLSADGELSPAIVAGGDTLREAASLMAEQKVTQLAVTDAAGKFAGLLDVEDLLIGRSREAVRENSRERTLRLRWPF